MGDEVSLIFYRGRALGATRLAEVFAHVTRGRLGDTTLVVAHHDNALGHPLHGFAVLEQLGRLQMEVATEAELAAAQAELNRSDRSLADVVRAAWKLTFKAVLENRVVDTRPGAPVQSLDDDWLVKLAARLSRSAGPTFYASVSDDAGFAEYARCSGGAVRERRALDRADEVDRAFQAFSGVPTACVGAVEGVPARHLLIAERGQVLARPRTLTPAAIAALGTLEAMI